jgi:hypothetical protein
MPDHQQSNTNPTMASPDTDPWGKLSSAYDQNFAQNMAAINAIAPPPTNDNYSQAHKILMDSMMSNNPTSKISHSSYGKMLDSQQAYGNLQYLNGQQPMLESQEPYGGFQYLNPQPMLESEMVQSIDPNPYLSAQAHRMYQEGVNMQMSHPSQSPSSMKRETVLMQNPGNDLGFKFDRSTGISDIPQGRPRIESEYATEAYMSESQAKGAYGNLMNNRYEAQRHNTEENEGYRGDRETYTPGF